MAIFNFISVLLVFFLTFRHTFASGCQADNVIRGIEHHHDYAFCSSLLAPTGVNTVTLATPTYLTVYPSSKISSAVSVLIVIIRSLLIILSKVLLCESTSPHTNNLATLILQFKKIK